MWRFCIGALAVLMLAPAVRAQEDAEKEAQPPSAAQQFNALVAEHRAETNRIRQEYAKTQDDAEKAELLEQWNALPETFASKFLELAQENSEDAVAQQACSWIMQYAAGKPQANDAARIILDKVADALEEQSSLNQLVMIATRTSGDVAKEAGDLLIKLVEQREGDSAMVSPLVAVVSARSVPRDVADKASEALIKLLESKSDDPAMLPALSSLLAGRTVPPALAQKATDIMIDNYVDDEALAPICLRLSNPDALRKIIEKSTNRSVKGHAMLSLGKSLLGRPAAPNEEGEKLLASLVADFADIDSTRGTLAEMAAGPLFEAQHLQIGMEAPNIEGADVDDEAFQLADYRGKVVVLDFWGDW